MNKYIFTFGLAHAFPNHHQVIYANNRIVAERYMCELYGRQWAFMYTEKEWQESIKEGHFSKSKALNPIYIDRNFKCRLVKENA